MSSIALRPSQFDSSWVAYGQILKKMCTTYKFSFTYEMMFTVRDQNYCWRLAGSFIITHSRPFWTSYCELSCQTPNPTGLILSRHDFLRIYLFLRLLRSLKGSRFERFDVIKIYVTKVLLEIFEKCFWTVRNF